MLYYAMMLFALIATVTLTGAEMMTADAKVRGQQYLARLDVPTLQIAENALLAQLASYKSASAAAGSVAASLPQSLGTAAPQPLCTPDPSNSSTVCTLKATAQFSPPTSTTNNTSGANVTANNVATGGTGGNILAGGVGEERLSVHVTTQILNEGDAVVAKRDHLVTVRLFNVPPYAQVLGEQDLGSGTTRYVAGEADSGGCDGSTGCDPGVDHAPDATTLKAVQTCVYDGYSSAVCGGVSPKATAAPQNIPWYNQNVSH